MLSRIMIVGGPGAGKTTLAHRLGSLTGLPVRSVDRAVRDSAGVQRQNADIDRLMREWAADDRWIIEGGNMRTYADRAARADLIIHLSPPIWLRFIRVVRRDGLNLRLLWWTLRYDSVFGPKDRAVSTDGSVVIESRADSDRLVERLRSAGTRPYA